MLSGTRRSDAPRFEVPADYFLEGIVLHAFEGKSPFGRPSLSLIAELKRIYKLDLDARSSHRLTEKP